MRQKQGDQTDLVWCTERRNIRDQVKLQDDGNRNRKPNMKKNKDGLKLIWFCCFWVFLVIRSTTSLFILVWTLRTSKVFSRSSFICFSSKFHLIELVKSVTVTVEQVKQTVFPGFKHQRPSDFSQDFFHDYWTAAFPFNIITANVFDVYVSPSALGLISQSRWAFGGGPLKLPFLARFDCTQTMMAAVTNQQFRSQRAESYWRTSSYLNVSSIRSLSGCWLEFLGNFCHFLVYFVLMTISKIL